MKKVLLLGAGLVSRPLVEYLLSKPDVTLTVASRTVSKAKGLVKDHPRGKAVALNVKNDQELEELVRENDLSISLLPYVFHVRVARLCIKHKKDMATTSYVSEEMKKLDNEAREAGIIILNEMGVDPGIDHMSAMKVIHDVERRGGKVTSFQSYCGGLPAPEANDNPFGYKFSWSPRGVLMAGRNNARYLEDGEVVEIEGKDLFDNFWTLEVPGAGMFEGYPNRDSLSYIDVYGLEGINTMFRGTLRNLGWCSTLKKMVDLGLVREEIDENLKNATYRQFMAHIICKPDVKNVKEAVAEELGIEVDSPEINAMDWLGLFSDDRIPGNVVPAPIDIMTDLMQRRMSYRKDERDMIVLHHIFKAEFGDHNEDLTSTLIDYGIPGGDSSMARTVSLPCAIGVYMILQGQIALKGVQVPVVPEIYEPVLAELENLNIKCKETMEKI